VPDGYHTLELSPEFVQDLISENFTARDRRRFARALDLLDENERHPSLRVHQLEGNMAGTWSASASDELRMIFRRLPNGRKQVLACTRHYAR
jgi:mRNA-degrading endonuclease YafQ of YafQ-DinJ toxin-antitoxin module